MKYELIKLAKFLMVPFGYLGSLARQSDSIPILMYHRVNDGIAKEISVTEADFRWQMEYLRRKGFEVISLDEAAQLAQKPGAGRKKKRVVLTFDDGYEDFFLHAYPVLCEYGYPATIYLVPGYIETGKVFWWDRDLGESRLMRWDHILSIKNSPLIKFGSHTMTHRDLDRISEEAAWWELSRSREVLHEKLGYEIRHFSYPRGIITPCAMEAASKLYQTAVSIFDGRDIYRSGEHPLVEIRRLPIQRSDGRGLFGPRLRGWLDAEGLLKKAVGRH
ncbi:hypothetical protein SDC9_52571 [bioreactor metagenome]|uniref:NodB homology domain-containing protein n=1 Tax=bioreactor metagenome TaxID=1076179 RepID=A0A644WRA7_9ZZZZ